MKFYNLGTASRPCGILRWRGLTIMLDSSLDLSPILNFLPLPLAGNSKFHNVPQYQNYNNQNEEELSELNGFVFVNSNPLFGLPTETSFDISDIDVILISNSASILALPFFTDDPNFRGRVYATEPTLTIGRFFMEELVEFVQNVPKSKVGNSSISTSVFKKLNQNLNFPVKLTNDCFKKELKEVYNKKSISEALLKVQIVGYNEHTDIFGKVLVTALSSGFSLGSCNWIIRSENKKISYISYSSTLTTHPSQMEQNGLKDSDVFILSGLNRAPTTVPDQSLGEICLSAISTLNNGGNVIFPTYPSGIIYDLFECLGAHLSTNRSQQFPFYFIAPQSESSLAYSNILSEWLSIGKQRKVYIPEDPFPHTELVKTNRLKHFKALHEINDLKQPSIVFCGHPSLRFGDIVHVIECWGSNPHNTIIFTDADLGWIECLIPYQPLAMKCIYCPIDPSLNFYQANKLIKELRPKILLTHEEYLTPHSNRSDLVIEAPNIIIPITPNSFTSIKIKRKGIQTLMEPRMGSAVQPTFKHKDTHALTITTSLMNMNNKYTLTKPQLDLFDPLRTPPLKYTFGTLDSNTLIEKLTSEGYTPSLTVTPTGYTVSLGIDGICIEVNGNSSEIICKKNDLGGTRGKIKRIILSCLIQI